MPRVFINLTDDQKRDTESRAFSKRVTLSNFVRALLGYPPVKQGVSSATPKKRKPGVREN